MQKALLLIDIQNDYFPGGANELIGSREAAQQTAKIIEQFRKLKLPIIHIQHLATRPDASFFIPQTKGAEIYPLVAPVEGEPVIIKNFPNSFRGTDLLKRLTSLSVEKLVVCGMMSHMCVDATVRAAKDFGFLCQVLVDCCATKDLTLNGRTIAASEVHYSFMASLNYFYAEVVTSDRVLAE